MNGSVIARERMAHKTSMRSVRRFGLLLAFGLELGACREDKVVYEVTHAPPSAGVGGSAGSSGSSGMAGGGGGGASSDAALPSDDGGIAVDGPAHIEPPDAGPGADGEGATLQL